MRSQGLVELSTMSNGSTPSQRTPGLLHTSAGLQISQIDDGKTQAGDQNPHLALGTFIIARKKDHASDFPQPWASREILDKHRIDGLDHACSRSQFRDHFA